MKPRKVLFVVASRANYARVKTLMRAVAAHPQLKMQLIVSASTLLYRFGMAVNVIRADGFEPDISLPYIVEGESLLTQAKSTGLGIIELASAFGNLNPDMVITVADRFETMATAIAGVYMNIPLVHIQGGEISGNVDDRVRHAITQMADYHFVATEISRERLLRMGQAPETVFNFGCPAMDLLVETDLAIDNPRMAHYTGVGDVMDWDKPYVLMIQHPVTTSYGDGTFQVQQTLNALEQLTGYRKVVLWPNVDAGSDDVAKGIRLFREQGRSRDFHFYKNFSPEDYARVLANAACAVGNSSSFLREGAFLGTPVVLVGDRQKGREHGANLCFCTYDQDDILASIRQQLAHGIYPRDPLFGHGRAGEQIAGQLATLPLDITRKSLTY